MNKEEGKIMAEKKSGIVFLNEYFLQFAWTIFQIVYDSHVACITRESNKMLF